MAERGVSTLLQHLPRVLGRAAAAPLNLGVAGAGALGAAALHSWPVLALGGAAYAAMVAWDVASPDFWRGVLSRPQGARPGGPLDARAFADPRVREAMLGMLGARRSLENALEDAPAGVRAQLGLALTSLRELEERAWRLAARGDELSAFLRATDAQAVREAIRVTSQQATQAKDAEARAQYASARAAHEAQLQALRDIGAAHDRVLANLTRIAATMQGLPAQVMRLRALDAQATESMYGDLNEELGRMNGELGAFEESLQSFQAVGVAS
ncbi:hypothetical protein DRW03_05550 [Corallococcus sp. H22C18031201]|nr:hypothetical protein DRW03_05550 [Corallococcus sp. H22C18031201]